MSQILLFILSSIGFYLAFENYNLEQLLRVIAVIMITKVLLDIAFN
jgi:hypothetical protein